MFNRKKSARKRALAAITKIINEVVELEADRLEGKKYIGYWGMQSGDVICSLSDNIFDDNTRVYIGQYQLKNI